MKFNGKVLIIGLGAVSRCTIPLLLKHLDIDRKNFTVMDFAPIPERAEYIKKEGLTFVKHRITKETYAQTLGKYAHKGDIIVDLAWNIGCLDMLEWCHEHEVLYINTSVELWNPYENAENLHPLDRTLYARQQDIVELKNNWGSEPAATAVLDHGANPGLVSHFTKQALEDIADKWISDHPKLKRKAEKIKTYRSDAQYNYLAMELGIKVIHISERDTQISNRPKMVNEFVNTWSVEGFYEEGIAPAELGWGTHEKKLPHRAHEHTEGPRNQICLSQMGANTWVRSWVPAGPITGMVIRHGEAYSLSKTLTVRADGRTLYRPTVHYAYCPTDAAIASLHELKMRDYKLQETTRIMNDDIVSGQDQLGCLLMGHAYKSWWIGSLLDITEARKLVPGQNATTLQVAASVAAAVLWMVKNPTQGVCLPDDLPHDEILKVAKPYLGHCISKPVDWTPLTTWPKMFEKFGYPRPPQEDTWQFETFLD